MESAHDEARRDPKTVMAVVGVVGAARGRGDERADRRSDALRHPLVPDALPAQPSEAAIVVTGTALPEAKAERAYDVVRISRKQIEHTPSHELYQLLK